MDLRLERMAAAGKARPGDFFIAGVRYCFALENDALRIPVGRYRVVVTVSNRTENHELWTPDPLFRLPLLEGVPGGRTGIRIHCGNEYYQSIGCVMLGRTWSGSFLGSSHVTFTPFFAQLLEAEARKEETWIDITEPIAA